jgi:glycosyltransferase involved in cell wall biosynthesis
MNQASHIHQATAASMRARREKTALSATDILLNDDTLRTVYWLTHARSSNPDSLTDERAAKFLLWFAVEGRHRYQNLVLSPAYLAFLAAPVPPYCSRLAAYILLTQPVLRERFGTRSELFHAWYYTQGAIEHGLAPLICPREHIFLAAPCARFAARVAPLTQYQYYRFLNDSELRRRFDPDKDEDRIALLNELSGRAGIWPDAPAFDRSDLPGVNVIGFGNNVMGIGEDVRALVAALGRAGIPRSIVNVSLSDEFGTSAAHAYDVLHCSRPLFPINIFALPPFETARLHVEHGAQLFHRRYSIGYWPWELTSLPSQWLGVFDLVDEVWAASDFLLDVYRRLTNKPVFRMPPYLNVPKPASIDLECYGVRADDFVFLTMCDFNSFSARKNPEGAIAAFRSAFPSVGGGERLIIKTLNAHGRPAALRQLEAEIDGDDRCILIREAYSRPNIAGLIARADCLLSLHRAEGFGRVIAEAMALGTLVVATDWSGSTSILDGTRGYPVSYTLRDVAEGEYVFHHGSQWAEPSIEDAVVKLRQVRSRTGRNRELRERARMFVESTYGLDTVATALAGRLGTLQ